MSPFCTVSLFMNLDNFLQRSEVKLSVHAVYFGDKKLTFFYHFLYLGAESI